jgi:hypothetical protein
MLKEFYIDPQYLTDTPIHNVISTLSNPANPTPDDLIKILKGIHEIHMFGNKDHDEFTSLRNQLEQLGYIKTERNWWNGDQVLKSFKLNGWVIRKNDNFPCAAALGSSIYCANKFGRKRLHL